MKIAPWNKTLPKLKKGAWFVHVRGSYLPMTPQAWFLHTLLLLSCLMVIALACEDERNIGIVVSTMLLQLVGIGTIFTYIAQRKS